MVLVLNRVPSNYVRQSIAANGRFPSTSKRHAHHHAKRFNIAVTVIRNKKFFFNKKRVVSTRRARSQSVLQTLVQPLPTSVHPTEGKEYSGRLKALKRLRRHWFGDIPQQEIDELTERAGLDCGGAPVQYMRDCLKKTGYGSRLFEVAKNCRFTDPTEIPEILSGTKKTCLTQIPKTDEAPPTRVILCVAPNGKHLLLPIHDLIPAVHCSRVSRTTYTSEPWESPIEPGTTVALPVVIIHAPDVDMFKALWAWFYTRDDIALLKALVPIFASIPSLSSSSIDPKNLLSLARTVSHGIAKNVPTAVIKILMTRMLSAHKIASDLGIVEYQPWALIDMGYRIYLDAARMKSGFPCTLSFDGLAPDMKHVMNVRP